jgi:acyl dehydratase
MYHVRYITTGRLSVNLPNAAEKHVVTTWEDIETLTGREFTSAWFSVDADRLAPFDHATYVDENPVQLEGSNFPDGLVEGFHLLGLLDHLSNAALRIDDPAWTGWNYGLDRVRFVSPITIEDKFRLQGIVSEVIPRGDGYLLLLTCSLEVEGRDRPGLTAEWRLFWTLAQDD